MSSRARWQEDDCPAWCTREHRDDDHPEDRRHLGESRAVPVIAQHRELRESGLVEVVEAIELEIGLSRRDGETTTWVYLGDGRRQHLELSMESARWVWRELGRLLA